MFNIPASSKLSPRISLIFSTTCVGVDLLSVMVDMCEQVGIWMQHCLSTAHGQSRLGKVSNNDNVVIIQEEPVEECTDGSRNGKRYFNCQPGRGLFVPLSHVEPDQRFTEPGTTPGAATVQNRTRLLISACSILQILYHPSHSNSIF